MPIEVIIGVNEIGTEKGQPTLLTFQDRHGHNNNNPDPYFKPIYREIEGVIDDEPTEENFEDDHEDMNNDPADQGEEVNEANENENENENEVPTLADGAEIEELPDELSAPAVPETTEEPQRRSGRIPLPVTRF